METRFKTKLDELFNKHPMCTRTKSLQLEELSISDIDNMYSIPKKSNLILVFDTETTGLINKDLLPIQYKHLNLYPYITQISAILYDVDNQTTKKVFNTYIKIPDDVEIPEVVVNLTGITREKCNDGMEIRDALSTFYNLYMKSNAIIAHNMWFDSKMIRIECIRNNFPKMLDIFYSHESNPRDVYCTMMLGTKYLGLTKFVRLSVLYELLFGEKVDESKLHNAMVDTDLCLKCYLYLLSKSGI
jgi:DNA polymerase III epsilon subunit-like protein